MRHLLRATRLLVLALALLLLLHQAMPVRAQDASQDIGGMARKFDEFEAVGSCDHGARLDNFAIALQSDQTVTGYIICYGPEGQGAGTGERRRQISEDYLLNTRGIDLSRFKSIYGGRYKEISGSATEFWIVPAEAEPPEPQNYGNAAATFKGLLAEYNTSDALYGGYEDAGLGPAFGNSPLAGLADILRQQPEKIVYIVAFNSSEAAPGAWRRSAREVAGAIEREHAIAADRIKIIYGGYRQLKERYGTARIQLWVAPADAPPVPPVKEPEPRPDKAVQIVSVNEEALSHNDNSQLAFEGFAEILKNDEQMRACIIIRLEVETAETAETEGEEQVEDAASEAEAKDETPKLDLIQLVEKWKSDLEEKYGINRNRLTVIVATAGEYQPASLETWVVPPGAQLPDPNLVEEDPAILEGETSREEPPTQ